MEKYTKSSYIYLTKKAVIFASFLAIITICNDLYYHHNINSFNKLNKFLKLFFTGDYNQAFMQIFIGSLGAMFFFPIVISLISIAFPSKDKKRRLISVFTTLCIVFFFVKGIELFGNYSMENSQTLQKLNRVNEEVEAKNYIQGLYEEAIENNDGTAIFALGVIYHQGQGVNQDYAKARSLFEQASELGSLEAIVYLGMIYHQGQGVSQDYAKAKSLFEQASELGNAIAMNFLGEMYFQNLGVSQDYVKAKSLFEKASELGNIRAMSNLGVMYATGMGISKDYTKAEILLEQARKSGNGQAALMLGEMYYQGFGVNQDYVRAKELFKQGCDYGEQLSCDTYRKIESNN